MDILEGLKIFVGYFSAQNVETQTRNPVINSIDNK